MDAIECGLPLTTSVPIYGKIVFDLGPNGSYDAAKAGVIPAIQVQGKKRVPVRAALCKLAGGDRAVLDALTEDFLSKFKKLAA